LSRNKHAKSQLLEHFQQKWMPVLRRKMRKNKEPERLTSPKVAKTALVLRVGLLSTLWVVVALLVIAFVSALIYREANERNFERLLTAHLFSLIGFVNVDGNGRLQGAPELGDIRYNNPHSGWYWEVMPMEGAAGEPLKSPSMGQADIASVPESIQKFDAQFTRFYQTHGLHGENILIVESDVVLENATNPNASYTARFRIMGNLAELEAQFNNFWATMRWYLIAFALLTLAINATTIIFGLRPLRRIRRSLAAIRAGEAVHLEENLPLEIQPLAREMNALIDNNRQMIERFRLQLGNLAHAMKTPLAVILNEAAGQGGSRENHLILEQAKLMQHQIQHHLQRAQMAAQRGSLVAHTDIMPVIERLVRVMGKLFPDKHIQFEAATEGLMFAGDAQDWEEIIGNLLENAGKWAKNRINIILERERFPKSSEVKTDYIKEGDKQSSFFTLIIEDDGPGLGKEEIAQALQRGRRLDESVAGSGLGLSIVVDMVRDYGGSFTLDTSPLGGLRACLQLPRAIH